MLHCNLPHTPSVLQLNPLEATCPTRHHLPHSIPPSRPMKTLNLTSSTSRMQASQYGLSLGRLDHHPTWQTIRANRAPTPLGGGSHDHPRSWRHLHRPHRRHCHDLATSAWDSHCCLPLSDYRCAVPWRVLWNWYEEPHFGQKWVGPKAHRQMQSDSTRVPNHPEPPQQNPECADPEDLGERPRPRGRSSIRDGIVSHLSPIGLCDVDAPSLGLCWIRSKQTSIKLGDKVFSWYAEKSKKQEERESSSKRKKATRVHWKTTILVRKKSFFTINLLWRNTTVQLRKMVSPKQNAKNVQITKKPNENVSDCKTSIWREQRSSTH